jgi:hypothetical protein
MLKLPLISLMLLLSACCIHEQPSNKTLDKINALTFVTTFQTIRLQCIAVAKEILSDKSKDMISCKTLTRDECFKVVYMELRYQIYECMNAEVNRIFKENTK